MLLTISSSLYVSTRCFIANCLHAGNHLHGDGFHMLIHVEVIESSLKDQSNTKFKERFYAKKKNLQSIKTKDLCLRKGTTCMYKSMFKDV